MYSLIEVEGKTKRFSDAKNSLADTVRELNDAVDALRRKYMPEIKRKFNIAAERRADLEALIQASEELFTKPRTFVFHGVKVGYAKGKGRIEITDKAQAVKLIKKFFPEQAETLIKIKETPNKDTLALLPVGDLKRLGITVTDTGDAVVIRLVDSEIDKMINKMFEDENSVTNDE